MKIVVTLLLAVVVGNGHAAAASADPEITSVTFQNCDSKAKCSELTRWTETHASVPTTIRVVATIANSASYDDEFFLLSTTEYVITPLYAYSIADFERLKTGNEVSWGQLTTDDDMRTFVLHRFRRETKRIVTLRVVNLRQILRKSFSDPEDQMWPWLIRVTAILINRQGQTLSKRSGILELAPSARRTKSPTR